MSPAWKASHTDGWSGRDSRHSASSVSPSLPQPARMGVPSRFCEETNALAEYKTYSAENLGSGTFRISKPKRTARKARQSKLKSPQRGARK